jgi:hypothetical protein
MKRGHRGRYAAGGALVGTVVAEIGIAWLTGLVVVGALFVFVIPQVARGPGRQRR